MKSKKRSRGKKPTVEDVLLEVLQKRKEDWQSRNNESKKVESNE